MKKLDGSFKDVRDAHWPVGGEVRQSFINNLKVRFIQTRHRQVKMSEFYYVCKVTGVLPTLA
jgi:hypothetical protein